MNGQIIKMVLWMVLLSMVSVSACLFYQHELYFCVFFALLVALGLIVVLAYSYHQTQRKLYRMVEAIRYGDFSLYFSENKKQSRAEQEMIRNINAVMVQFRNLLSDKEERYRYFDTLLDTVDTSMLVTDMEGKILWMNRAGVKELCGYTIHHLEELKKLNSDFPSILEALRPGEVKVVRIYKEDFMQDMAVTVTEYSNHRMDLRLLNLKNIRSILEENEMEAWQKLVRVLTHEIMNSITPIISLSDTICERALQQGIDEESVLMLGMKTIHRRSKGLLGFVENYRKLSRIASPILTPVRVGDWIGDIKKLFPSSSETPFVYQIEDEDLVLMIDRSQMEQVLINLLKNANEACEGKSDAKIVVKSSYSPEKHIFQLTVTDNGSGILAEAQDKIFIPFFTTKPTGSGIGLSLCKHIVTLHGGSIQVHSEKGEGSCFTLKLLVR